MQNRITVMTADLLMEKVCIDMLLMPITIFLLEMAKRSHLPKAIKAWVFEFTFNEIKQDR